MRIVSLRVFCKSRTMNRNKDNSKAKLQAKKASDWSLLAYKNLERTLSKDELRELGFISKATRSSLYQSAREVGSIGDSFFEKFIHAEASEGCFSLISQIAKKKDDYTVAALSPSSIKVTAEKCVYLVYSEDSKPEVFSVLAEILCDVKQRLPLACVRQSHVNFKKIEASTTGSMSSEEASQAKYRLREQKTDEQRLLEQTPYVELFTACLKFARDTGVSDIHFESRSDCTAIRMRRHGQFFVWQMIKGAYAKPFFNHTKKCCNLSLGITRMAQDTRISLPNWNLDVRVNSMPTLHLLDLRKSFDLETAGFSKPNLKAMQASLKHKNGLILVTGPTGSGKTTTLYSLLCELDHDACNIITIENPVEYSFPGISQVQITESFGFQDAIRAILRQDPDVILVGEIRDRETAELCLEASATGHLVLSTLHTNGALEAVSRLVGLGIDKQLIGENLRFCATQSLKPIICSTCSKLKQSKASTCNDCQGGIVGRSPEIEFITQKQIRSFVSNGTIPRYKKINRESTPILEAKAS